MPDLTHLLALRSVAAGAWDAFAGWGDWRQKGDRMVSPSGKRTLTLEAFARLKGRAPKESPEKAKGAAPKPKAAPVPKGQPKPGEANKIAQAVAKEAAAAVTRARAAGVTGPELDTLRKRADAAAARAKAPAQPNPTLPLSSLPAAPPAEVSRTPGPRAPVPAPKVDIPAATAPKTVKADPNPVLRRTPTQVQGKPIVARTDTNRAGVAAGKARAEALAKVKPLPPRPDGAPDVKALKEQVDNGIVSTAAMGWGYDFKAARAALNIATTQIDDFYRRSPRKVAALAREITGEDPESTEDGVKLLKEWVAETLDLLEQKPSKRERGGRVTGLSERAGVSWFAEARRRVGLTGALFAALAG